VRELKEQGRSGEVRVCVREERLQQRAMDDRRAARRGPALTAVRGLQTSQAPGAIMNRRRIGRAMQHHDPIRNACFTIHGSRDYRRATLFSLACLPARPRRPGKQPSLGRLVATLTSTLSSLSRSPKPRPYRMAPIVPPAAGQPPQWRQFAFYDSADRPDDRLAEPFVVRPHLPTTSPRASERRAALCGWPQLDADQPLRGITGAEPNLDQRDGVLLWFRGQPSCRCRAPDHALQFVRPSASASASAVLSEPPSNLTGCP
jgi:hypothetical protein